MVPHGARTVRAVATDKDGRIYAGTDRGLMIYDTGGGGILQLLLDEQLPDLAFDELEQGKLRAEGRPLLDRLPADSQDAQRVRAHSESLAKLEAARGGLHAESTLLISRANSQGTEQDGGTKMSPPSQAALADVVEQREREHRTLLVRLEQDSRSLYQMLELKPLDLSVWRKNLRPEDVVVQYLPMRDRLLVHLAARDRTEVREVKIGEKELSGRAQAVAAMLSSEAAKLGGLRAASRPGNLAVADTTGLDTKGLQDELHALYEALLRPVEHDLSQYRHVYIAPVGALTQVPFAALIRTPGVNPTYAAQRFELGVLPSLYLLDLVLKAGDRNAGGAVLFGNPDGTLPGAEREAREIGQIVEKATVRIGSDASVAALRDYSKGARWLHIATHGHLNGEDPSQSYLVMAGRTRFSMIDAMQLPLDHTETVVLSACESGLGSNGLEYATLARAFTHAGATSVVASLWRVHDDATEILMKSFYQQRQMGKDVFLALASAQREMIARGGPAASPAAWSGFLAFGRP